MYTVQMVSTAPYSLKAASCIREMAPTVGMMGEADIPRTGEGGGASDWQQVDPLHDLLPRAPINSHYTKEDTIISCWGTSGVLHGGDIMELKMAWKGKCHSWVCKDTEAGDIGEMWHQGAHSYGSRGRTGSKDAKGTLERALNVTPRHSLLVPLEMFSRS